MRIMGIDVGHQRVGVALSDELGLTAQPLTTVNVKGGIDETASQIAKLCLEHGVETLVIGLPLSLDGGDRGAGSRAVRAMGRAVAALLEIEIVYRDERFTTAEAERMLVGAGMRREKRRQVVDRVAATLILQGFLDARSFKS